MKRICFALFGTIVLDCVCPSVCRSVYRSVCIGVSVGENVSVFAHTFNDFNRSVLAANVAALLSIFISY